VLVDVASVAKRDDHDEKHVVFDGVNNPIVPEPDPESGSAS
jgi:hypothetical protein